MTDGEPTRRRHHQPVSTPSRFDLQEVQQTLTPSCVSYGAHSGERSDSFTHLISLTLPPPSRLRPITPPFQRNRANHQCPDSGRLISCISACTWHIILGSHSARQSNSPLLEAHSLKPMSIWE
ncbi:hypothetical protein BDDG_05072 [Blastomyces dermatitidis ATCC 18188]|uniref:Uncharacterized protein n=1 Tax=Ajellomyces dermatitidis (strain ATCC 18188 / CBS 674.68) TaxID=653446 RepID=F2TFW6_AJEDA|nr:hypothetical protein BDDG_05072 [Blastomyces dermatitidis ATCC 18188]